MFVIRSSCDLWGRTASLQPKVSTFSLLDFGQLRADTPIDGQSFVTGSCPVAAILMASAIVIPFKKRNGLETAPCYLCRERGNTAVSLPYCHLCPEGLGNTPSLSGLFLSSYSNSSLWKPCQVMGQNSTFISPGVTSSSQT